MIRCERYMAQHERAKTSVAHKELKCGEGKWCTEGRGQGEVGRGSLAASDYVATSERRAGVRSEPGWADGEAGRCPPRLQRARTLRWYAAPVLLLSTIHTLYTHQQSNVISTGRADVANHIYIIKQLETTNLTRWASNIKRGFSIRLAVWTKTSSQVISVWYVEWNKKRSTLDTYVYFYFLYNEAMTAGAVYMLLSYKNINFIAIKNYTKGYLCNVGLLNIWLLWYFTKKTF